MTTLLIPLLVLLLFAAGVLLFRTALYASHEEPVEPAPAVAVDSLTVADHLARVIRCETISHQDPAEMDGHAFYGFQQELASMYPRLHRTLSHETVNKYSLLFTWQGSNPELNPILLAAHQDVVPVEPGTEGAWEHPPFAGTIADGYVWGRGTLDDKYSVIGIMEAVEALIQQGFHPERTVYLAFGHDEEVSGTQGAAEIARLLEERGVQLDMVIDEGGMMISGLFPGVERPLAMVGVAEKGYLNLELTAGGAGGHAATPLRPTAVGRLSRALHRLETHPMRARLDYFGWILDAIASDLPFGQRLVMANRWLFGGLIQRSLSARPTTNALIRTTMAPTLLHAGIKENILPTEARCVVNIRLLPNDTVQSVVEHVTRVIDDPEVHLRILALPSTPAGAAKSKDARASYTQVSDARGPIFALLAATIRQVFPEAAVAPYLLSGATDSRYYAPICPQVFRFAPVRMEMADLERVHGTNERLAVKSCGDMVIFYQRLVSNLAGVG